MAVCDIEQLANLFECAIVTAGSVKSIQAQHFPLLSDSRRIVSLGLKANLHCINRPSSSNVGFALDAVVP